MNYNKELSDLKESLDKAKSLKYRAEARLEQLNKQEEELIGELKELGINPNDLEKEINVLKEEISQLFSEAKKLLPEDI